MGVTPREIVDKVFTKSFRGYDEEEVDLFLDEVIKELESKNHEIQEQLARISELTARLNAAQQVALPPNMLATQRSAEEFLASANMKARTIVQQAEQNAQTIREKAAEDANRRVSEAHEAAKRIMRKAEHEAAVLIQKAQRDAIGITGTEDSGNARERLFSASAEMPAQAEAVAALYDAEAPISDQINRLIKMLKDLSEGQAHEGLPPFDPAWEIKKAGNAGLPPMPPASPARQEAVDDDAMHGGSPLPFGLDKPESAGFLEEDPNYASGVLPFEQDENGLLPEDAALPDYDALQEDEFVAALAKLGIKL